MGQTLFDVFYEVCLDLGVCEDVTSWADFFDVLPPNARRYVAGTLRPRPERVQIWCDRLREVHGHHLTVELPPSVDEATLVVDPVEGEKRSIRCRLHDPKRSIFLLSLAGGGPDGDAA